MCKYYIIKWYLLRLGISCLLNHEFNYVQLRPSCLDILYPYLLL